MRISRRDFTLTSLGLLSSGRLPAGPSQMWVYLGTYTRNKSKGIYALKLDMATGGLSEPVLAAETSDPSFLTIHSNRKYLYAVGEMNNFQGKRAGAVSAFSIDAASGKLTLLNQQSSGGSGPCHIIVDRTGKYVLLANYGGGSVTVLPIDAGGKLGEAAAFIQHQGSSANPKRQQGPHAHSINVDRDNRFAVAADLGLDQVLVYRFDASKGTLTPNQPPHVKVAPGSGPRHFAFHPNGRYGYVINEMLCTVTVFSWEPRKGVFTELQTITTLPEPVKEGYSTAEVQVHPSGKFLYGSNRGHDTIAIFQIDSAKGTLTAAGHTPTQGRIPRNFGIDPTGTYLLAANQNSDSLVGFRIDQKTGALTPTGHKVEVGAPVCVKFLSV